MQKHAFSTQKSISYTGRGSVTEPTNYTKLNKKIIHQADDLANLSPYNPVVCEIMTDFKPTYIPAKIVISLAVTITNYIKVHIADTSEFKHSYYKPSSNKSSGSI
jgi:subtilase family serine protease